MSLLKHYISKKLNPVPIKFKTKKDLLNHFQKRKNLLQNHLKIPELTINKSEYLEFGCNGGENACYFAENGANIYLSEPNKNVHKLILNNFNKINKKKSLKQLSNLDLNEYKINKKFNFVIAEGFLNTLKNRNNSFKKLTSFMNKKSILIINYDDVYGGIFEMLKSYLLLSICKIYNIDRYSKDSLQLAKKLFAKEFKKINVSRSFYAWWADQLVNPYAAKTWSVLDLLKIATKNKLSLYSTSPVFFEENHFQWYKNVNKKSLNAQINNHIFSQSWKKSVPQILFGPNESKSSKINFKNINSIKKLSKKISTYIANPVKEIDLSKSSKGFIEFLNILNKNDLSKEIVGLITKINTKSDPNKIINYYTKTKHLQYCWGSLLHYVAFIKE